MYRLPMTPFDIEHFGTPSNFGGAIDLGERLNGIQEVSGSIPLISTMDTLKGLFSHESKPFLLEKHNL